MVNGNDMIEFQEQHLPEIHELECVLFDLKDVFPELVAKLEEVIANYIEDEYTNAMASYGDMLYDQAKEGV